MIQRRELMAQALLKALRKWNVSVLLYGGR
jgi:hypothetical protein